MAAVGMYHVNNISRVTVYMSDMSSFADGMKCVTSKSVCYVVQCMSWWSFQTQNFLPVFTK